MAKIEVVRGADTDWSQDYAANGYRTQGDVRSSRVSPAEFSLWLVRAELADGATIEWPSTHGDESVFVVSGGFDIDGRTCPPEGAAVIEADVAVTGRAVGPTSIVHVGPTDPAQPVDGLNGAPSPDGHGVHVVGPRGTYATTDAEGSDSHYYADSTCPTCRITLLHVGREQPYVSAPHCHSQDELIHLISGSIFLGRQELVPGDTLAIGADVRYGFRGADTGFRFLNYRRDASFQSWPDDRPHRMEGGLANGLEPVMDLIESA